MAATSSQHSCLFCGQPIEPRGLDPLTAVVSVAVPPEPDAATAADRVRRRRPGPRWWRRPPGQYWMHESCLRQHAHPSVQLQFLEALDPPPRDR
jgi:hypothetical protein